MRNMKKVVAGAVIIGIFIYVFNFEYFGYFLSLICNSAMECVTGGDEYSNQLAKEMDTLKVSKFISLKVNGKEIDLDNTDFGEDFYNDIIDNMTDSNEAADEDTESGEGSSVVPSSEKIKPSLPEGNQPSGNYAREINDQYKQQNKTANLFASKGYNVEMLDEIAGGNGYGITPKANPDFIIEGKIFDCYTPKKYTEVKTIIKKMQDKTKNQAHNIILNLELYEGDIAELLTVIKRKANPSGDLKQLEELWIVKNNELRYAFD